jgi:hypothetical protein
MKELRIKNSSQDAASNHTTRHLAGLSSAPLAPLKKSLPQQSLAAEVVQPKGCVSGEKSLGTY